MPDSFSTIRGKCVWWRESSNAEDLYDSRIKDPEKRIECSCFVEGDQWVFAKKDVPSECPEYRRCRYFVKGN